MRNFENAEKVSLRFFQVNLLFLGAEPYPPVISVVQTLDQTMGLKQELMLEASPAECKRYFQIFFEGGWRAGN